MRYEKSYMSKFLDRLERISLGSPGPIGFGMARSPKTPGMALVGGISSDYSAGMAALADLAPDAALISGAGGPPALKKLSRSLGEEIPWGVRVSSLTEDDARAYED